ncbi:MAG: hypothetical protein HGA82_02410, partial [Anaerolineales bacterium]|nr:hypothetical protein [Anaerolineales bacterium]
MGISPSGIQGYPEEKFTHSDVARVIAEGDANVGLG